LVLSKQIKKEKMNIKIKGWEKISGYTYKGHCIVNPIHNAGETKYMADVLDLNLPHRPKWELNVLSPGHKFKSVTDDRFHILLWDEDKYSARKEVSRDMILSVSSFRTVFENLVDELLQLRKKNSFTQPTSVTSSTVTGTAVVTNTGGGIINNVMNSSTTIDYGKMMEELIKAIKEQDSISKDFKKALTDAINDL
jgi:hypothetical protein